MCCSRSWELPQRSPGFRSGSVSSISLSHCDTFQGKRGMCRASHCVCPTCRKPAGWRGSSFPEARRAWHVTAGLVPADPSAHSENLCQVAHIFWVMWNWGDEDEKGKSPTKGRRKVGRWVGERGWVNTHSKGGGRRVGNKAGWSRLRRAMESAMWKAPEQSGRMKEVLWEVFPKATWALSHNPARESRKDRDDHRTTAGRPRPSSSGCMNARTTTTRTVSQNMGTRERMPFWLSSTRTSDYLLPLVCLTFPIC